MAMFSMELLQLLAGTTVVGLLATIVLGILAVSQIRRSQGRYRGYGLAIFPLVLCPFLMLLFGIACSSRVQTTEESYSYGEPSVPTVNIPQLIPPQLVPPQVIPPEIREVTPPTITWNPTMAVFGPVIQRTLEAGDGASNVWFNLETGQAILDTNEDKPNDDEEARQWRVSMGVDVAAVLNHGPNGLAGVDMSVVRVADSEWYAAMTMGVISAVSAGQSAPHLFMVVESNALATYYFKTRNGVLGILQITGVSSHPRGVNFQYKLVQPAENAGAGKTLFAVPSPVAPPASLSQVHADLEARFNAASGMTSFPERDTAMAGVAGDAARAGDTAIVKQALGRMTAFPARDDAAAAAARALLKLGQRAEAYNIVQFITNFTTRDEVLAEIAKESAKAGDAVVVKESLARITNFSVRDDTTLESSRLLVKAGLRADALAVARKMTDFSKRDEALRELAQ